MNSHIKHGVRVALFAVCLVAVSQAFGQAKSSAAGQFRKITVITQPKATVWIDDVRFGSTGESGSLEIATVRPGAHTVRVRANGFKEVTRTLTAAQRGDIKVDLVATTDQADLAFQEGERLAFVDREKSAEAYRRAIAARPNYPVAYLALARVLMEADDLDEAKKALASARKLRPGFAEASAVEGRVHKEYGEPEKAIAAFKRAITEGKGFQPEAYTGLGLLYKERAEGAGGSGDYEKEEEYFAEASKYLKTALTQLAGAPDASVIYQLQGLIYERQKMYKEAIALYEEFLRLFPNSSDATAVRSFIVQIKKDMNSQ